jgi:hypothetical protein
MRVNVIKEAGYEEALLGISLSREADILAMPERAKKLAPLDHGHNKFLESMILWIDVNAPRYWWQEADTYRLSTKQSASSMYLIMKRELTQDDFQDGIDAIVLGRLNDFIRAKDFMAAKRHLPEAFLQRRLWCMSYKTFKNIYEQRRNHKLKEWHFFLDAVLLQIEHATLITGGEDVRVVQSTVQGDK